MQETFGGHILDCDDSFMDVYVCWTYQIVYFKYVYFIIF